MNNTIQSKRYESKFAEYEFLILSSFQLNCLQLSVCSFRSVLFRCEQTLYPLKFIKAARKTTTVFAPSKTLSIVPLSISQIGTYFQQTYSMIKLYLI